MGTHSAPGVIINLASSAAHDSCHCPAASNSSHWGTHASHFTDGNTRLCSDMGRFLHRYNSCSLTDQHSQPRRQVFTCVSGLHPTSYSSLQVEQLSQKEQWLSESCSSLSLCISVSPHHGGGMPTKAFVLQWAMQQNLHKHADSVLLTEGKKGIEKSRETTKTEEGRKTQLWKRKGSVKMFVLCVCVCVFGRENMLNRGRQQDISRPSCETHWRSKMNPAPREVTGRRGCVGRVRMDGWREVGCCVTWWRELSSSSKTQDLGAVSCREKNKRTENRRKWGGDLVPLVICFVPLEWKTRELRWQLPLTDNTTRP